MSVNFRTLWPIDLAGALLTAALLYTAGWYALFRADAASTRVPTLALELEAKEHELRVLRATLQDRREELDILNAEIRQKGRLPDRSPLEQDLATISSLAEANGVTIEGVEPIAEIHYPSVLERCLRIQTVGSFTNHLRFLRAFESCSFWADITYLKLEQTKEEMLHLSPTRHSSFVLSSFSAVQ